MEQINEIHKSTDENLKKVPIIGILAFITGVVSIVITIILHWTLHVWVYGGSDTEIRMFLQITYLPLEVVVIRIMNIISDVELVLKPIGLILSIIAVLQKNTAKGFAITGLVLNIIGILWTIALMLGLPIL